MRSRVATVLTVVWVFSLSSIGHGQTQQTAPASGSPYIDPVGGLTLNDAIGRAVEREPGLRASRSQIDVSRALREQASLRPNPSVSF
jgi:hypothetical protein